MKSFILSILFLAIFQICFAQKYEYNIFGEHFSDTLSGKTTTAINPTDTEERKAIFESPEDTTYVYHLVGEGEGIESILNLYQVCAPCIIKWNDLYYHDFATFRNQKLYTGEYLKVALKKDYEKGTAALFKTRRLYQNFLERIYIYDISQRYEISYSQLRSWNNLDESIYYVEDTTLIVGEMEYKYACPCLD